MLSLPVDASLTIRPDQVLLFTSDLHCRDSADPTYRKLIEALEVLTPLNRKIFFVYGGDIFESMVGDKKYYRKVFPEFFKLIRNFEGVYLTGNHDFGMNKILDPIPVFDNAIEISQLGKKTLCHHGDLVDEQDVGYLRLRKFLRSSLAKCLIKMAPGFLLYRAGIFFSSQSQDYVARIKYQDSRIERQNYLKKCYETWAASKEKYHAVICGHNHLKQRIKLDENGRFYLNPGFPASADEEPVFVAVFRGRAELVPFSEADVWIKTLAD